MNSPGQHNHCRRLKYDDTSKEKDAKGFSRGGHRALTIITSSHCNLFSDY